jgi:hypothetical protein
MADIGLPAAKDQVPARFGLVLHKRLDIEGKK